MRELFRHYRRGLSMAAFALGIVFLAASCGLLARHTRSFSVKRDTALMLGSTLPEKKSTLALLEVSVEAQELFMEDALASREEQVAAYILSKEAPAPRLTSITEEAIRALRDNAGQTLSLERLTFDSPENHGSYVVTRAHLKLKGSFAAVSRLLTVLGYGRALMVRDVLSDDVQNSMLARTESASPLSLRRVADFLYADLLRYAAAPDATEQAYFKDLPVDVLADIRALALTGGLDRVRSTFQGIARHLQDEKAWPFPLTTIESVSRDNDVWTIELQVFGR